MNAATSIVMTMLNSTMLVAHIIMLMIMMQLTLVLVLLVVWWRWFDDDGVGGYRCRKRLGHDDDLVMTLGLNSRIRK